MVSAAEMLEFLQRRTQLQAHRLPPPGEFPAGWQGWFASMREHVGAVTGATADAIVELLTHRPLAAPPGQTGALTRWQSFAALWRQEWTPSVEDPRAHRFATVFTVVWHLLVTAMLLWLMYLQYVVPRAAPAGEDVTQVEYIGVGTPREVGGGAARPAPADAPAQDAAAAPASPVVPAPVASAAPSAATEALPPAPAPPEVVQPTVPPPAAPAVVAEQPVAVSEPSRTEDPPVFELPPPRPRVAEPTVSVRELRMPTREVQVVEVPAPVQPVPSREVPLRPVEARALEARTPAIVEREIPAPLPRVAVREIPSPSAAQPRLQSDAPAIADRAIPVPAARTPSVPTTSPSARVAPVATAPGAAAAATTASAPASAAPSGARGPTTAAPTAGVGPAAAATPGAWPSPRRGDDWGDSTRDRPGAQRGERPGLYNADGSLRLGEPPGSASPGQPPGTVTQEIANLDRAGTWLKRKPNDYEPTAFDALWRPNETLLQEWVRRSIKTVVIPVPGTGKRITCSVALLALGGACGISDPNLNEQPAVARPPPDIPFKPHLQEDNGSVRPGG